MSSLRQRAPGDLLLHPAAVVALTVVILNDQVLKVHYPSAITGKLSDFAGLVYFPLFLVACAEGVRRLTKRGRWELGPSAVTAATIVVGISFVLIKTWGPAGDVYRSVLGAALVEDETDLIAVIALLVPVWVSCRVMRRPAAQPRDPD